MYKSFFKNIGLFSLALATLSLGGCLKDKGYDDGEYGTLTGNTTGKKFISIPLASNSVNVIGVEAKAGFQDINLFNLSYDYQTPATSNMDVKVAVNNALVTAADPTLVLLPTAAYQIVNLTTTFKPGQVISDPFVIKLSTDLLDPTKKYGIGISLDVLPAGVEKSANLSNAVFAFTIKNKYDGIYSFRCQILHPPDRSATWNRDVWDYPYDVYLITTGPNSVKMYNDAFGAGYHPLVTTGVSGFGGTEVNFVFDGSDKLVNAFNSPAVATTRQFTVNPAFPNSKYVPATKKVYAAILMQQTGFIDMPIFDTMTFKKARP